MRADLTAQSNSALWVARAAGGLAILVGGGHVLAWVSGMMPQVPVSTIIMKTNAGLGLLACGVALILLAAPAPDATRRRAARACAGFVLLLGLATLSEHIVGWNLGIDQLLATEPIGAAATTSPNRMGPPASLSFILLGTALLLLTRRRGTGRRPALHEPFALTAALLGLLSIIGYLYGVNALYHIARYTGVAWPTALSFVVLAVGVLCADPANGLMSRVTADEPGGAIIRALLGPMVLLPLALGWVRLAGERRGWFDAAMGTGLMMLLFIVTFSSLLLFASRRVSLSAAALHESERVARHQKDLLAVTLASIGDAVIVTDAAGAVTFLNGEAERLTGWTDDDARGRPLPDVFSIVNEQTRERVENPVERVLRLGQVIGLGNHTLLVARDGREIPIDDSGAPIRQAGGDARGVVLVFRDISERKRAERLQQHLLADVQTQKDRLTAVVNSMRDEVWFCDTEKRFTLENPAAVREFELGSAEVVEVGDLAGRLEVFRPDGSPRSVEEAPPLRALQGEAVINQEEIIRTPASGELRHRQVSATPVRDASGNVIGSVSVVRDITDRKRAEDALREADRRKNDFLAVLSHELRNPLAPVRAALYILARAAPGGEQSNRAMMVLDRQVAQLTRLVDDLLDVTRITRGKIHLHQEPLDLTGLVRRTAEDHRSLFATRGIDLDVDIPDERLWVNGDALRLAQSIGNLLHNAAKFTERGGRTAIRVRKDDASDAALISVRDTGVGLSPQALPHLFEPFMQVDSTIDRTRGGLGLGLALTKSLVEMHGGAVSARSGGVGHGAEFTIRLPLQAAPSVAPAPRAVGGHQPRRVFIIEDNVDAADSLREALELAGHEVEVAYDGAEGIEGARRFSPEIVLCDIGLPGMNGYEVARALRNDQTFASVYLVALTGYALPEDLAKAREAGFDLHVSKPPSPEELQEALAALGRPPRAAST